MKKNKTIISLIIVILVISGIWYFTSNQKQEVVSVKISDRGLASALPIYVAIEKGFFAKYDLKPELIKFTTGNDVLNALIRNDLDIGEIPVDPLIFAEDKTETKTKIFLVGKWSDSENRNFDGLLVRKESKIKSLTDLVGKKVGVFPGITAKTFLSSYLDKNRVSSKGVEFIELAPNVQLQSLSSGAIDALFAYQPTVTIAEKNNDLLKIDESIFNKLDFNYFAVYSFSDSFVKSGLADKAQEVFSEAIQYMKDNQNESRQILSKYTSLGNLSLQMTYFPQYHKSNTGDVKDISGLVQFYFSKNLIKSMLDDNKIKSIFYGI
ncbi:MAG: NrtA/SsuA/CpmA family ABC transporter substrate-binding protein [bacterium]|nr:NrtA/SsuA/CpmA family ABC transporter substrate-binding protein [bacterium]